MKPSYLISNRILSHVYKKSAVTLEYASKNLAVTQERYLMNLLRSNADCYYGKINGFNTTRSVNEFQKKVPVTSYEDYFPLLERIMDGEKNILTNQEISRFAMTSGTASDHKLIPYTKKLIKEFYSALGPWMHYNYGRYNELCRGTSFWVITPAGDLPEIKSKVPVRFDEDSYYFGRLTGKILKRVMVLPDAVSRISDIENYYYVAAYFLISSSALRLISVWNPYLLTILCDKIKKYRKELISDVKEGSIHPPSRLSEPESRLLIPYIKARPKQAARLMEVFTHFQSDDRLLWAELWPNLSLISCWTDGWAGDFLPQIRQLFPGVPVQGKGLLATEAIISIPFTKGDPVLAATSHFYEFIGLERGDVLLAHQLKKDEYYEVVVTTGGGFYRYRLNDIIQVTGFYHDLPRIRFIGKTELYSDICGEKLHEYHVSKALKSVFLKYKIPGQVHFLTPDAGEGAARYLLYISEKDYAEI